MRDEYTAVTRFADLDTQRHVTSRTYESFALEGRYRLLDKLGFSREKVQNEQIYLDPVSGYVKFHRQQFPGVELKVETHAFPAQDGNIHWDQKIFEKTGELVCHLQQLTRPVRGAESLTLEIAAAEERPEILYSPLKPWSGSCERVIGQYTLPYSDRDFAGKYNLASLWKIFEEGRWIFVEKVGLTYQKIVELDTTSFFMGSICNILGEMPADGTGAATSPAATAMPVSASESSAGARAVPGHPEDGLEARARDAGGAGARAAMDGLEARAGRTLQVMTWIERVDKIRYWFRQDAMHNGKVLISMRDEQLMVSLSRARPQRASEQFMRYLGKYVEYP